MQTQTNRDGFIRHNHRNMKKHRITFFTEVSAQQGGKKQTQFICTEASALTVTTRHLTAPIVKQDG